MRSVGEGPSEIEVVPLSEADLPGFHALFDAAHSTCFCRYWHFTGNKNDWLERGAFRPEENFEEQAAALRGGDGTALGLIAKGAIVPGGATEVIGWMKVAPRATMPKLRALPVYRNLALGPEATTFAVGCFLIHPGLRKRGVARALLAGAEDFARTRGAQAIEGYPRRSEATLHDEEAWQGPEAIFRELGYEAVVDVAPYPVYRKVL